MWWNTFYNAGGPSEVIIRVYDKYVVSYFKPETNIVTYIRAAISTVKYVNPDILKISYIDNAKSSIGYVKPETIKITYICKQ